ncbi:MAG: M23 family metallopeptidase [Pyrinomonadaceae bacterium]
MDSLNIPAIGQILLVLITVFTIGCVPPSGQNNSSATQFEEKTPSVAIAGKFSYPIGTKDFLTQAKDSQDEWFNALDFGEDNHLGEDWNKNSGGNTDCGEPVFAAADGVVTYAGDAGPGWGNVLILTHTLPDGNRVQTLYGHMQEILRNSGDVKRREKVGTIGNANGKYLCHLHFEIRTSTCPMWDQPGGGYSSERTGWVDPSDFIDSRR